jgi:nucleoside-diphosphate-sugar epimerase
MMDSRIQQLAKSLVGRENSFLSSEIEDRSDQLDELFYGKKLLISGAAGFIASQTIETILTFEPSYIGLVDISENGLAELVRRIRTSRHANSSIEIEPWLVDIASPNFDRLIHSLESLDTSLNFAASKHVRTERNVPSILRMLETNILGTWRMLETVGETFPDCKHFMVSTDKACNPSNLMGASKLVMEKLLFSSQYSVTTARFANVAYSSGSLLESWLIRMQEKQPLVVPRDTWRYFVTPEEAGHICVLATSAPAGAGVIPIFGELDAISLEDALEKFLGSFNLVPHEVETVSEGLMILGSSSISRNSYPIIRTARDTSGEKRIESFTGPSDEVSEWIEGLDLFRHAERANVNTDFLDWLRMVVGNPNLVTNYLEIQRKLTEVCPEYQQEISELLLDNRA